VCISTVHYQMDWATCPPDVDREDMADDRLERYLKNSKWLKMRHNVIRGIDHLS
jgi:hypothetical protein